MIEITIKTLDSRNHEFSVQDDLTVKQLKEQIAESVSVPAESQRLIYCGRVLLDDKKLSEYDVSGKVIHLVQRAPPNSSNGGSSSSGTTTGNGGRDAPRGITRGRLDNAMYLGAMAFPADLMEAQGLPVPPARHALSQSRLGVARSMLVRANAVLQTLEGRSETSTSDPATPAESSTPAEPVPETSVEAEVTISTEPPPPTSGSTESNVIGPRPEQIAAAAAEAVTAALGHALNVHHAGNVSITLNNGDVVGNGDDLIMRVTQGSSGPSTAGFRAGRVPRPGRSAPNQRTSALADLVTQLREVQRRMEPYLDRYHALMRDDPPDVSDSQQVFNQVSELMHVLAHAYHALSDIMCDLSQQPPRVLRCRPVLIQHSTVLQTGIPIQVPASQIINFTSHPNNNNQTENGSQNGSAQSGANQPQARTERDAAQSQSNSQTPGSAAVRVSISNGSSRNEETPMTNSSQPDRSGGAQQGPTATVSISPSNLEIFMDVSSGSITFDSVEATVLHASAPPSAASPPSSEQSNQGNSGDQHPWGQPPPNDLIQNLFHRFYNEMSHIHNNNYNNNNNNNNSSSSSNNSNGSTTAPQPQPQPQPQPSQAPAAPPASQPLATSSSCSSTSSANPETTADSESTSQTSASTASRENSTPTTAAPTTTPQPRSTFSRPHIHIGAGPHIQTFDFFDPFLPCNSHHIRGRRRGLGSNIATFESEQQQQTNGGNASRSDSATSGSSGGPSRRINSPELRRSNVLPSLNPHIIPFDIIRNLQAALGDSVNIMSGTVAQLLECIPGQTYTAGQSLIMDFFMAAGRNVMIRDTFHDSSPAMLGWMRHGLREYLENSLGVNSSCPESAVQSAVDRINAELTPFFESSFEGLTMREDVDLPASIRKITQTYLPQLIKDIHQGDNFSSYIVTVSQHILKIIRALVGVLAYTSQTPRINSVLLSFCRKLVYGNSEEVRFWLCGEVMQRLHQAIRGVDLNHDYCRQFIVLIPPPQAPDTCQPMPMEIEETTTVSSAPPEREVASSPLRHSEPLPNIIIGSEPWHHDLPSDWVPIITRDRERQRRGANQGPLSDAYLAGMPSKRRKLLTDSKPNSALNIVISESMGRALGAAGLAPSAAAGLVEAAACDSGLRNAYKAQVRSSVESTLRSHPDYHPDKYPNTAKYFNRLNRS